MWPKRNKPLSCDNALSHDSGLQAQAASSVSDTLEAYDFDLARLFLK